MRDCCTGIPHKDLYRMNNELILYLSINIKDRTNKIETQILLDMCIPCHHVIVYGNKNYLLLFCIICMIVISLVQNKMNIWQLYELHTRN